MIHFKRIFLISFLLSLLLAFQQVQANKLMSSMWVSDNDQLLSHHMHAYTEKLLKEMEKSEHIHLSLVIVNGKTQEDLNDTAIQTIVAWEAKYPHKSQSNKSCYLVLDLAKQQVLLLLGNQVPRTQVLEDSLNAVKMGIILPALQNGQVERAIVEGLYGLSVAMQDWPQHQGQSAVPMNVLKWLVIGLLLVGLIYGLKKYFQSPVPSAEPPVFLPVDHHFHSYDNSSTLLDLEQ